VSEAASDYAIYRQVVTQLMSGEEQLPSLPTITLDIRRALSDPEVTLVQLSRLISRDPALSAILMKYASSALLRTQQPPKSLLDVLRVLGMAQVDRLTDGHESKRMIPWAVGDAPDEFITAQLKGIVGIEVEITAIDGKWKVSQNRGEPDRRGVAGGLTDMATAEASAMNELVKTYGGLD